jgi:hypothetical protein
MKDMILGQKNVNDVPVSLRIDGNSVGAAFQPRLTIMALERPIFVAGKPLPRKVGVK